MCLFLLFFFFSRGRAMGNETFYWDGLTQFSHGLLTDSYFYQCYINSARPGRRNGRVMLPSHSFDFISSAPSTLRCGWIRKRSVTYQFCYAYCSHLTELFENAFRQRNLKSRLFRLFVWTENIFRMEHFENDVLTIITWFPSQRNSKWAMRFYIPPA